MNNPQEYLKIVNPDSEKIRVNFYITQQQQFNLNKLAAEEDISVSHLVREGIDLITQRLK